jgi:hypothetical protein
MTTETTEKTAPETPVAPTPPPVTPPVAPPEPPKPPSRILSNILGLLQPDEKDVRPPEPLKPAEKAPEVPPPPEKKKVAVKVKLPPPPPSEPVESVEQIVRRTIAAQRPAEPSPAPPPPPPEPEDLTPEESEELALARYAEARDPARKGLGDRYVKFYAAHKTFLEKALAEDADYEPASDPKYKAFLGKNDPGLTAGEKRRLQIQQETDGAEARAYERAKKEFMPEVEQTKRRILEIQEKPKIDQRANAYVEELADGMPAEVVKFHRENGRDVNRTREAFPTEFDVIANSISGAVSLGREFLEIRAGVTDYDPKNDRHQFINKFVNDQGELFQKHGGAALVQNGKRFVPPSQWKTGMAATHWTFSNEDVLHVLKLEAQREAKSTILSKIQAIDREQTARQRRTGAPSGVKTPPPPPAAEPSTKTPATPMAGAANTNPPEARRVLSSLLGFGA